jgi:hypothetical protein
MPVKEARQQLGGISPTTFYALVKEGELSLVKIGGRSFVHAEELGDLLWRTRYDASGRNGNWRVRPSHANAIFAGRTTDASKRPGRVSSWVASLSRSG